LAAAPPPPGLSAVVFGEATGQAADAQKPVDHFQVLAPGQLSPAEYDGFVRDIVNFLDYAGEPVKDKRQSMGVFVTLFLLVFFVFAYLLKKEYWKDVH